jgi:outer membrane protein TolC
MKKILGVSTPVSPLFSYVLILWLAGIAAPALVRAQEVQKITLEEAVNTGLSNYQSIRAKQNYVLASGALKQQARNEYLPNVTASVQQSYGTVNGQLGPLGAVGVLGVASAGPVYQEQSWNAGFGALYLLNTNWEVFSFGRVRSRVQLAEAQIKRDSADLLQEQFIHRVRISSAYLNLLITQRLVRNAQSNLERTRAIQQSVRVRTKNGLNAGVDSSLANAEFSRARLVMITARDNEQQASNQLAQLMNVPPVQFELDTAFFAHTPVAYATAATVQSNPQVRFYQARIDQANLTAWATRKSIMPGLTLFGVYQARASDFDYNYTPQYPDRYSTSYADGINPSRYNYVAGISIFWNLMSPLKIRQQARSQQFVAQAYEEEYNQVTTQLQDQLILADQRIENMLEGVHEVPAQYQAAHDAYIQKSTLYKNGLTTIVDLQQAMFALNRAETDLGVAYVNVWQALLQKAAASGDFELFIGQTK